MGKKWIKLIHKSEMSNSTKNVQIHGTRVLSLFLKKNRWFPNNRHYNIHTFKPCPLIMRPSAKDENITFVSLSNSCWLYFVISVCSPRAACSLHTWNIRESYTNAKVDNRGSSSMFALANKNPWLNQRLNKCLEEEREYAYMYMWNFAIATNNIQRTKMKTKSPPQRDPF